MAISMRFVAAASKAAATKSGITDVTEQRRAEDEQRRAENEQRRAENEQRQAKGLFKTVVDQLPAATCLKDAEGRYTLANSVFCKWFVKPGEDIIGKTTHDIYPSEIADKIQALDAEIIKTKKNAEEEICEPFADGSERILQIAKFPICDDNGEVIAVGSVENEIDELLKKMGEAPRYSKAG